MNYTNKFHTNAITFLGVFTVIVAASKIGGSMGEALFYIGLCFFSLFNGRMRGTRNADELLSGTFDVKRAKRVVKANTVLCVLSLVGVFTMGPLGAIFGYLFGTTMAWCILDLQTIKLAEAGE